MEQKIFQCYAFVAREENNGYLCLEEIDGRTLRRSPLDRAVTCSSDNMTRTYLSGSGSRKSSETGPNN